MTSKTARIIVVTILLSVTCMSHVAWAQSKPPALNGSWAQYRGGRGADPKRAPPPASPIVLKPDYDKPYQARRAAETAATQRGEPLPSPAVLCVPYGMPS